MTDPLGLAGFALFLLFSVLSLQSRGHSSLRGLFAGLSLVAVLGGLALAYVQHADNGRDTAGAPDTTDIQQKTSGPASPNVAGTKGDVKLNVNIGTETPPRP
ncbi:MAG: hypothetical protein IPK66_15360 [Rhodospirillales bacterium]|nr:hypothetical protein [Rhodospirillales bacterium]